MNMNTNLIYYLDPYLKQLKTSILAVNQTPEGKWNIQLSDTIYYPEGGGQPGDKGIIEGKSGIATLLTQKFKNGKLLHVCEVKNNLNVNEGVVCNLDWDWRYKYMKIHSAGHLIHDVLMSIVPNLNPLKGGHGSKAFIEYSGIISPNIQDQLEQKVNEAIILNLPIKTWESSVEQLRNNCKFIPPNLPVNKPIRAIQIGEYTPMPDGGVQVKSTKEIGKVQITSVQSNDNLSKITYRVIG